MQDDDENRVQHWYCEETTKARSQEEEEYRTQHCEETKEVRSQRAAQPISGEKTASRAGQLCVRNVMFSHDGHSLIAGLLLAGRAFQIKQGPSKSATSL